MSLVLEVEYLSGICFAALGPDSEVPDWPPQPDRVFSALVASWGARGEEEAETRALEWLEAQPPPLVEASEHFPRTAPVSFVPPNDPATRRSGNAAVLPALRPRQPRRFPAARPLESLVRFYWTDSTPDEATFGSLQALASCTSYVGHSASLTRCFFRHAGEAPASAPTRSKRRVYPGRLRELRSAYQLFVGSNGQRGRPLHGAPVNADSLATEASPRAFADRWLLLEHVSGTMPDIRASALVAKTIRDALLSGYRRIGLEDAIPEVLSGHGADGSATRVPHVAIIPLTFTGFLHADGHVLGFALVPPVDSPVLDDNDFRGALRKLAPLDERLGRRLLVVKPKPGVKPEKAFSVGLSPTFEPPPGRRSLDPTLYTQSARTFATVTPLVLDRHLKLQGDAREREKVEQIVDACRNVGLPDPAQVLCDKHSAIEGAPSAWRSGNAPAWTNWRLPPSLAGRQLVHAVLRFDAAVKGPVILGAGRFVGLGLCRPLVSGETDEWRR